MGSLIARRVHVTQFQMGGLLTYCTPDYGCDQANNSDASSLRVVQSLIDNNHSSQNGAGVFSYGAGSGLSIEQSAIVNNFSDSSGGGVFVGGGWGVPTIEDSTISGNTGFWGGGINAQFAPEANTYLWLFNTTVANNHAFLSGGGIFFYGDPGPAKDLHIDSSIINNNTAGDYPDEPNINSDWGTGNMLCDRNTLLYIVPGLPQPTQGTPPNLCRFDVTDAVLGPLMPMGGAGNLPVHALLKSSPAIDAAVDSNDGTQQRDSWSGSLDPPSPPAWTLWDRVIDGDGNGSLVRDLGAYEANTRWQTELLALQAKGSASLTTVTSPSGYDRGAGQNYASSSATNQFVTYVVPVAQTGSYSVGVGVRKASNAGRFQLAVASSPGGPWTNIGSEQDTFASSATFSALSISSSFNFGSVGQKYVRFTVTGKNGSSSSFQLFLDYVRLTKL